MQKWEYAEILGISILDLHTKRTDWYIHTPDGQDLPAEAQPRIMKDLGEQGWEMVAALPYQGWDALSESEGEGEIAISYTASYHIFFKRLIS